MIVDGMDAKARNRLAAFCTMAYTGWSLLWRGNAKAESRRSVARRRRSRCQRCVYSSLHVACTNWSSARNEVIPSSLCTANSALTSTDWRLTLCGSLAST